MTSGSAVLTSASGLFTSNDVGKLIAVSGAAASGGTLKAIVSGYTPATPPLPTACANQDAVPVGQQHPCRRASDAHLSIRSQLWSRLRDLWTS